MISLTCLNTISLYILQIKVFKREIKIGINIAIDAIGDVAFKTPKPLSSGKLKSLRKS